MSKNKGFSSAELEIIGALTEFRDALKSDGPIEKKLTIRTVELDLSPHTYAAEDVKHVRKLLKSSQGVFARFLGVSVKTVQGWEQGIREPNAMACRFMDELRRDPEHWKARIAESAKSKGCPAG
jgi:putative transcriptional regulator